MSIWTRSGKQYIKNTRGPEGMRKLLDFYDYGYDHDENTNVSEFKANDRIMRPVNLGAHDSMLFESGEDYLYRGNNIYECFKEDVKNRTIYAKLTATYKAFYKRAENIFGVNSPMDNLLTERISAEIHYKALQAVDKLIYTLCERYGYQYEKAYSKEWMKCPIVIRTGNKFFQGRLLPYFSHEDVIINHEIRNFVK